MKKLIRLIILLLVVIIIVFSPIFILKIYERVWELNHKHEYVKKKVKIDSISQQSGFSGRTPSNGNVILYYEDYSKRLYMLDDRKTLIRIQRRKFNNMLDYLDSHKDSIWIWEHAKGKTKYALEEETEMNTKGYLIQIILNIILLTIALYSIVCQIKKWMKSKKNEKK
ncbi:hypothetical protein MWU78_17340 [Arenibacter sp. F26102]|uniref:hypothetical protein n=1 Tax=Arenibacter sp. F26102 TaxID=2926416 RepID=UPI001FF1E7D6|nr:hypothetical protein [Arenibacter sp. F26102]MCK0147423.1 hypothetical protein [Arenibacter sp. F26102]